LSWFVNDCWGVPKLFQAKSSRKLILMSGHAEGLMLSLNVWLLKSGATKRFLATVLREGRFCAFL
jgi:hypothetical protein